MTARLTVSAMDSACMDKMRAARDRGFTSVLLPALDEKISRALTAMGFRVVSGNKGIFVNWDRPRATQTTGIPVNIASHYRGEKAEDFCLVAREARTAYKARMAQLATA